VVAVIVLEDEVNEHQVALKTIQLFRECHVVELNEYIKWSAIGNTMFFFSTGLVTTPAFPTEEVFA
jgi:hypothetical protein